MTRILLEGAPGKHHKIIKSEVALCPRCTLTPLRASMTEGVSTASVKGNNVHTECSHLVVVGWKLIEELLDSELLSGAVHVGDLLLGQAGEIQLDLADRGRR